MCGSADGSAGMLLKLFEHFAVKICVKSAKACELPGPIHIKNVQSVPWKSSKTHITWVCVDFVAAPKKDVVRLVSLSDFPQNGTV